MEKKSEAKMHAGNVLNGGRSTRKQRLDWRFLAVLPAIILYLEICLRLTTKTPFFDIGLIYLAMFSVAAGILLTLLLSFFGNKVREAMSWIITIFFMLFYGSQFFYYSIFGTFYTFYSMINGGAAFQFLDTIITALTKIWIPLLLYMVPVAAMVLFHNFNKKQAKMSGRQKIAMLVAVVLLQGIAVFAVWTDQGDGLNSNMLYFGSADTASSVARFGALTAMQLDIQKTIFPPEGGPADDGIGPGSKNNIPDALYAKQIYNLDFDKLIANAPNDTVKALHEYFANVTPTNMNSYSGKFAGYNLILITAEGFSPYVIDKKLTPTLYRMATEGYQFTNFYNPVWGVSTSDGEYTLCTGQIPKPGVWSFKESAKNDLPFTMGNQYRFQGLTPRAYHNHSYNYYDRDLSHPNAGYRYMGRGNGLDMKNQWPESDLEMMEKTVDEYIDEPWFHTYYMTVSGHLNYSFTGNMMAVKHKSEVANLDLSESCKAYIACNMEFDRAMGYLIQRLEDAGIADKTLIVFSNDHYPYGLTEAEYLEIAGLDKFDPMYEMYKSRLVIWSGDMQGDSGKVIDKICYQPDIIPTISNLLGLPYDSRMLSGTDIFSDSEGLVIYKDYSWQTEKGIYITSENKFYPVEGISVDDSYVKWETKHVRNTFWAASKILETNYFKYIISDEQANILNRPIPLP
jgi:phosphoglycerol transferase MdoB-like AlkP superfamily enzyme